MLTQTAKDLLIAGGIVVIVGVLKLVEWFNLKRKRGGM